VILVRGLGVRRGERVVLDDVSFAVQAGDWLCTIGPNGAGKSTLLAALAGLLPLSGRVDLGSRPLGSLRGRERARTVALVPQQPILPEGLRVADYVLLGRTPHLGVLAAEGPRDVAVVRDTLDRLDLWWAADRRLDSLSGGELQRVVLARALAQQAPILLLDEPTTGLDLGHQQRVLELVEELRRTDGLTVVSAMHDLTLAGQFAERFLLLDGGHVVADGGRTDVLDARLIRRHYGASVRVIPDGAGGTIVVPVREGSPVLDASPAEVAT
jgi:iron complex transport system ATP-binding protein